MSSTRLKLPIFILLLSMMLAPAESRCTDLAGIVREAATGTPLPSVSVVILETGDSTVSDALGFYFFPNLVDGTYTVLAGKSSYVPRVLANVTVGVCCVGFRGNINNDPSDGIDVSDVVYLVSYSFKGGPAPPCPEEANVNGIGGIDIADLTVLISYSFKNGPAPPACP